MGRKRIAIQVGDIFRVPVDDTRFCYGQVVDMTACFFVTIYEGVFTELPALPAALGRSIAFLANIVRACLEDGHWEIVGRAPIPTNIVFSEYLRGPRVISHRGENLRAATDEECATLKPNTCYSPAVIENAIRYRYEGGPWQPWYDNIIYHGPLPELPPEGTPLPAAPAKPKVVEHRVVLHLPLSAGMGTAAERRAINVIERRLRAALEKTPAVGDYDGNEIGGGDFAIFLYGPNAAALFTAIRPILAHIPLPPGAYANLYDADKDETRTVPLRAMLDA